MSRALLMQPSDAPVISMVEVLRRALEGLGGGKWIKDDFYDGESGGACALGAVATAMKGRRVSVVDYGVGMTILLETLQDMHPELQLDTIPDLNDDPTVTYEDILAAFEKTALICEEKGI